MTTYEIQIKTGNVKDAGTDAHVFITIIGTAGTQTWTSLDDPKDNDDFEKNGLFINMCGWLRHPFLLTFA